MTAPRTCSCFRCGYTWLEGYSGEHYCLDRVVVQRDVSREALSAAREAISGFYAVIAHGDDAHRAWLKLECDKLLARAFPPLPEEP